MNTTCEEEEWKHMSANMVLAIKEVFIVSQITSPPAWLAGIMFYGICEPMVACSWSAFLTE